MRFISFITCFFNVKIINAIRMGHRKSRGESKKHEVSFQEAETVFADPFYIDFYDDEYSVDEHRFLIVGESDGGRLLIVSYAEKVDRVRIISARELMPQERKHYEQHGFKR
jgi:uncharacterized protein